MIALYAFPRSGGTLLSTILMNHPDVFVTSEFHQGTTQLPFTDGRYSWQNNIEAINLKFGLELNTAFSLTKVDDILRRKKKLLVYRAWIPGYITDLSEIQRVIRPERSVVLIRNFFHSILSTHDGKGTGIRALIRISLRKWWVYLFRIPVPESLLSERFEMYKLYIDYVLSVDEKIIVHYEDLVKEPRNEIRRTFDYLGLNVEDVEAYLHFDFDASSASMTQQMQVISGDTEIKKTSSIKQGKQYPKWRIREKSYKRIRHYLERYAELKYLDLG